MSKPFQDLNGEIIKHGAFFLFTYFTSLFPLNETKCITGKKIWRKGKVIFGAPVVDIRDFNGNSEKPFPFQFLVMGVVNALKVLNSSSLAVGHMPTGLSWMKRKNKKTVKRKDKYYLKCKCQCTSWLHTWIILTIILCLWNPEIGCDKCLACIEVTQKQHCGQSLLFLTWEMGYRGILVGNQINISFHLGGKASI